MVRSKRVCAWLVAAASLVVSVGVVPAHEAWAQDKPITRDEARALFDEALALEAAGDYTKALEKLQGAAAYKRTPNIRYNIGLCYEKLGKLVQALGEYRIALADAEADPAGGRVVKELRRAIEALEPRIPTISITRGENAIGARVLVDGREAGAAEMAEGVIVDPGTRVVEASLAGYETFRQEVRVSEGSREKVEVKLAKAKPAAAAPDEPEPAKPAGPPTAGTAAQPATGGSATTTAGWIVTGVGVVSLGVSGLFYSKRSKAISDLEAVCGADKQSCPAASRDTYDKGKSDTMIGNVALGVGAAGVVTGVILLLSGSASSSEPSGSGTWISKSVRVTPAPPGAWAGMGLDGHF